MLSWLQQITGILLIRNTRTYFHLPFFNPARKIVRNKWVWCAAGSQCETEKKADADSGTSRIFRHTNHDPSPVALFSVAIKRVAIETVGKNSAAGSPKMHLVWHVLGAISNSSAGLRFHWKSWQAYIGLCVWTIHEMPISRQEVGM